jgi:DNA-binding CsgD family transcriptional regulator
MARAIGVGLRTLGVVEGGAEGLAHLEEAVAVLADSPARLEHARALVELGAARRRANQRAAAREPLRQGLDLAHRCGATRLAQRARDELAASGARPRREMITGRDALTATEQRIAAMAADGMSNPQIAQALFVTRKTVENHLGRIYPKLGIRSRDQLAAELENQPEPA